jgi:hypothetical protein
MLISIYHNVSLVRRGLDLSPATFSRSGKSRYKNTDTVAIAFSFRDEISTDPLGACERAFEIGNVDPEYASTDLDAELARSYRTEQIRSVSNGDVVTVDGHAYVVDPVGFRSIGSGAGMNFAGGRTARDVRLLAEAYERGSIPPADRTFIESLLDEDDTAVISR